MHLGRQKRIGVVELRKERFQERDGLELLGFLEEEVPTVLQHAAAHDQDDDGDVLSRLEEAEHVHVLALERLDHLPLRDVAHGSQGVAIRRGHLEVLPFG